MKSKPRPAWSLSEAEAAAEAEAEESELLGFAEQLDWEAFIDQLDDEQLAQAFQVCMKQRAMHRDHKLHCGKVESQVLRLR